MRIFIVGGTGHIGSYLVPRLLRRDWEVTVLARNPRPQYTDPNLYWPRVNWMLADRAAEEASGAWAARMAAVEADAVIDLTCFTPEQNRIMYEAFRGRIDHFLHCGTIWAYGPPQRVPAQESDPRRPIADYGRDKAAIESFLIEKYRREGFPATIVHPGHISGRQWLPIDPQGSRDGVDIYRKLAHGETVVLPDNGQATIHHVHGDDVAQQFELALLHRSQALGESFSAVAPYALTLEACCTAVAAMFGRRPEIQYVPLDQMAAHVGDASAAIIADHVKHSPNASIAKAERLLGNAPRYTTEEIYAECLEYLLGTGELVV